MLETIEVREGGSYEVLRERVRMPLPDDGWLATDLYRPARGGEPVAGRFPAVMTRTAYDKGGGGFVQRAAFFASHGYLGVVQDVRGTFGSPGEFVPFVNEVADGEAAVAWVVADCQCNGKVGTYGCSYMGWVQLAMAIRNPPGLACMIPFGTAIDTYHHYAYPDGARQLGIIRWLIYDVWRRAARDDAAALAGIEEINFLRMGAELPWARGKTALAANPHFEGVIFDYLEHETYDDFWRQPGLAFEPYFEQMPDIPVLWVSGWFDGYPRSSCAGYAKLTEMGRGANQHLLLGPWIHNQMSGTACGDGDFGEGAEISRDGVQLAFFDRWLKGDSGVEIPKARAFVMGGGPGGRSADGLWRHGGSWWQGNDWPPPGMRPTPWYLHAEGGLSAGVPAEQESSTAYVYDPANPAPSIAPPWHFPEHAPRGPSDQVEPTELLGGGKPGRRLEDREDVVIFRSKPLASELNVLGPLEARLWVSSDAPDTDFTIRLVDEYPEGYGFPVAEGLTRLRMREGTRQAVTYEPGEVVQIGIECFPAANRFMPGHRVAVYVTSSNYPRYDINRNTDDPASRELRVAVNRVHHGAGHASMVMLPVLG